MKTLVKDALETLLLALLLFLVMQVSIQNFRVLGGSMEPSLFEGQYILVNKLAYFRIPVGKLARIVPFLDETPDKHISLFHLPQRGEIIVFPEPTNPSLDLVKRIIAGPGDEIQMRQGQVYLNGEALEETYLASLTDASSFTSLRVPEDHYFVMGDNRRVSNDSRSWGPIHRSSIVGRAWVTYWPPPEMGFLTMLREIRPFVKQLKLALTDHSSFACAHPCSSLCASVTV